MIQSLKVLVSLAKDPGSTLSPHMVIHNDLQLKSQEIQWILHAFGEHTFIQTKHIHISKFIQ